MKKILNYVLILVMTVLLIPNVFASNNVSIDSITLKEKSDDLLELSKPTINGMNLGFNLSFLNIGDKAKYEVIISNNSNKDYYIDNETKFNKSNYITYTYEFEDKDIKKIEPNSKIKMYITIEYTTQVPPSRLENGMYTEDNAMSMDLTDVIISNPKTYSNIIILLLTFITLIVITIVNISKKKRIGINILLIGLLLIPLTTYALERITITATTKITIEAQRNIIESRYLNGAQIDRDFWQYQNYIESITFETKIEEPVDYSYKFDVSAAQNNSIIAYLVATEESVYDLYIMSNGYIYANPDSSYFLKFFKALKTINNLENYKTIYATDMSYMFYSLDSLEELDLSSFDTSKVTNMESMLGQDTYRSILKRIDISSFDTSKVTNMSGMFHGCIKIEELDLKHFDTSNVTNMNSMFSANYSLQSLDISNFDTSKVTNMEFMFTNNDTLITLDISSFDTSKVENMRLMFGDCDNIETIYISNKWSVENVTEDSGMFLGATKLPNYNSSSVDKTKAFAGDGGYLTLKS